MCFADGFVYYLYICIVNGYLFCACLVHSCHYGQVLFIRGRGSTDAAEGSDDLESRRKSIDMGFDLRRTLNLRTTTSQECEVVPRRARI